MPTTDDHLALARRNKATIDYLLRARDDHFEWIATVAFYAALHFVEAVFFSDDGRHGRNHENREHILKSTRRYQQLHRHYRPLWQASVIARYMGRSNSDAALLFRDYMSPDEVEAKLVRHHLVKIEQSATRLIENRK